MHEQRLWIWVCLEEKSLLTSNRWVWAFSWIFLTEGAFLRVSYFQTQPCTCIVWWSWQRGANNPADPDGTAGRADGTDDLIPRKGTRLLLNISGHFVLRDRLLVRIEWQSISSNKCRIRSRRWDWVRWTARCHPWSVTQKNRPFEGFPGFPCCLLDDANSCLVKAVLLWLEQTKTCVETSGLGGFRIFQVNIFQGPAL